MDLLSGRKSNEIFEGQVHVYKHMYAYLDSMCLKWCIELEIPTIIYNHEKPITLHELISILQVPPSKISGVERLMRHLSHNRFFDIVTIHDDDGGDENKEKKEAYALTIASELLVKGTEYCLTPMAKCGLNPLMSSSFNLLGKWTLEKNLTLSEISLGTNLWDFLSKNPSILTSFNESMASDSQMVKLALKDHSAVFEGLESIVDVGGGNGTISKIISDMFPKLKCIVFDLPHVVENFSGTTSNNLSFVGGDMFNYICICKLQGKLLFLFQLNSNLWILHDWDEEHCVKILKKCKDAISNNTKGGKAIVIDLVINEKQDEFGLTQMKLRMDIAMTTLNGKERSEEEFKKLFLEAGF
ncbi:hypothetical protein Ahy_A04g017438 [Arachis hypogaea]|uniref:Isoflavone 7-O-methyltransferase n=1 Tax=Arachis hypogaea TaxID=3818 RepID=A0A445DAY4_ARAHY|nr:hypothetical protein Ahy_A04g017438 [Arachis hypogaea]